MAKLKAHGIELARRDTPTSRIALMSDGQILRNYGDGWKLWKKLKPGVDVNAYAVKFQTFTANIPSDIKTYIDALKDAVDLAHRARLHTLITLMPEDVDGIKTEFDDYGYHVDYEDVREACQWYSIAQRNIQANLQAGLPVNQVHSLPEPL